MSVLVVAVGLSIAGSIGGMLAAASVTLITDRARKVLVSWLISYAVGTLLGAALLKLVPEALESLAPEWVFSTLLIGIVTFFVLEKVLLWRHCHDDDDCQVHATAAWLIIIGDAVHTFVDGAIIAAATLTSVPLGISTAIAAAAHEIPQEVGDVSILLHAGYSSRRAVVLNLLSAVGGVVGAVAVVLLAGVVPRLLPYALAFAAGSFMYVAMSDLIPGLHRGDSRQNPVRQVVMLALGVATIAVL